MPEPEGVFWRPLLAERDCVRLAEVSEGLRQALEKGSMGFAHGKGPDGTNHMAYVWGGDCVFIEIPEWELALKHRLLIPRHRAPIPEPEGVVWESS
jgi:hypothetical protein